MIKTFKDKETRKIFFNEFSKHLPEAIQERAAQKLYMIEAAGHLEDLRLPPSNHLEKLKGNRNRQYSIRINSQWRICFFWENDSAYEVEITDYH